MDDKLKILNKKLFQISAKGLIKDFINGYKIINGEKIFSGIFQSCRVFIPTQKYIKYFNFALM